MEGSCNEGGLNEMNMKLRGMPHNTALLWTNYCHDWEAERTLASEGKEGGREMQINMTYVRCFPPVTFTLANGANSLIQNLHLVKSHCYEVGGNRI